MRHSLGNSFLYGKVVRKDKGVGLLRHHRISVSEGRMAIEIERITNGPNSWGLIIDGLAKRGAQSSAASFTVSDKKAKRLIITALKSDWCSWEGARPSETLFHVTELTTYLGKRFDWENAWWFEGYDSISPDSPVWGFYDPHTRKGAFISEYAEA